MTSNSSVTLHTLFNQSIRTIPTFSNFRNEMIGILLLFSLFVCIQQMVYMVAILYFLALSSTASVRF